MLIRKADDGTLTLDQGGVLVAKGQRFDVYRLGDKDVVKGGKESLGRDETWIAAIEVVRVEALKSYAKIVKGEIDPARCENGAICRPAAEDADDPSRAPGGKPTPSAVKIDAAGGVKLPFD